MNFTNDLIYRMTQIKLMLFDLFYFVPVYTDCAQSFQIMNFNVTNSFHGTNYLRKFPVLHTA